MMGFNIMAASHFDEYLVDFTSFKAGPIDPAVFDRPALCKKKHHEPTASDTPTQQQQQQLLTAQAMSAGSAVMPWARVTAGARADSSNSNADAGKGQQQRMLQLRRLGVLYQNQGFVEAWNQASNAGFKLSLNRFASWLPEEYGLMTGLRSSSKSKQVKEVRRARGR
jgi:hypothetical protein